LNGGKDEVFGINPKGFVTNIVAFLSASPSSKIVSNKNKLLNNCNIQPHFRFVSYLTSSFRIKTIINSSIQNSLSNQNPFL